MRSSNVLAVFLVCGSLGAAPALARETAPSLALPGDSGPGSVELQDSSPAGEKLKLTIDRSKVDLERHRLEVTMNRPAARVVVKVYDEDGSMITEKSTEFEGAAAGKSLPVTWEQSSSRKIAKVEVFGYDTDENWVGVAIIPWSLRIPHEEVLFETDKAAIRESELPKLQNALATLKNAIAKYDDLGAIQLFIAGHTDTVGTASYNQDLSRRRARSIATWFVKSGLRIPVAYEGFGESAPLVPTKDEVDEPRNRRVDYILTIEVPVTKIAAAWKYINK